MRHRWLPPLLAAAVTEALAYFLSLTWGFMALLLAFLITSLTAAANGAKSRSTEARVNAIVPVLGTHSARITTAQNAANGAQSTASTANTTANNAQGTANNAQATANGAIQSGSNATLSGLHVTGSETVDGGFTVNGASNFNALLDANNINCSGLTDTGSMTVNVNLTVHGGGNVLTNAGGALTLGTSGSGSPDGNTGSAWGTGERTYINGLWAAVAGLNNYING